VKQNPALLNSRAREPWTYWGRPQEALTDRSRSFYSASPLHVLTELEYGGTRETDPES
jgi:hypothetical protein